METTTANEHRRLNWRSLSKRLFRSKSVSYAQQPSDAATMPSCVPASHNNVSDVNANVTVPNATQDSKLHKIMACLFWKKKTDVVDMKKEQKAAARKKMAVDRSERSRRVLQMEAMKEAPKTRDTDDPVPPSPGANKMFLPSENPTASFLSYLDPSVRRACSEVIRTNSETIASNTNKTQAREAFVDPGTSKQGFTRNTSYRAKRVTDREPPVGSGTRNPNPQPWEVDRPPKPPERTQSQRPAEKKKPIVVPGTMACSDDDIGYNSDNDISDLHDELSRMNMSQPDLRYPNYDKTGRRRRREGSRSKSPSECSGSMYREGSISLSEASSSEEETPVIDRPSNPSPGQQKRKVFHKVPTDRPRESVSSEKDLPPDNSPPPPPPPRKSKPMEKAIDDLFMQTQQNIEHIYRNGLDNMDLDTFRSETVTPETCMKRMEGEHVFNPTVSAGDREQAVKKKTRTNGGKAKSKTKAVNNDNVSRMTVTDIESPHESSEMDSLLTEVSIWAKDRQNWLLEDGKLKDDAPKERTQSSFAGTDDKVISAVSKSNKERCTEWVEGVNKPESSPTDSEHKHLGILTGPKLYRSPSRNTATRKVSFSDNESTSKASSVRDVSFKSSKRSVLPDTEDKLSRDGTLKLESLNSKLTLDGPEPWTADMYNKPKSRSRDSDRSTINDNLSELDQRAPFRARSPDSWLSSTGSCSRLLRPESVRDGNDSFGTASPFRQTPDMMSVKRTASEPAKSHQIIRKKPVIHTPFAAFDRQNTPMPNENGMNPLSPLKPIKKTNQLKPLSMQVGANFQNQQFPGLRSNHMLVGGSRNMNDYEPKLSAMQSPRPFSEIPVRDRYTGADKGALGSSVSSAAAGVSTSLTRPNSETIPPSKRADKIGTGNVMATDSMKERNKYARDIVNSFNTPRTAATTDAFQTPASNGLPEFGQNQPPKQKRHTVFNQKMINGGYNYEKHSRRQPSGGQADFMDLTDSGNQGERPLPEIQRQNGMVTSARGGLNSTSVSELTLNVQDSYDGTNGMRPAVLTKEAMHHIFSGNKNTMDIKIGASFNNGSSTGTQQPVAGSQTAEKFKRLRSRRDQEMEWLMKDAAETEV